MCPFVGGGEQEFLEDKVERELKGEKKVKWWITQVLCWVWNYVKLEMRD